MNEILHKFRAEGRSSAGTPSGSACRARSASVTAVPVSPPIMPGWDRYPVGDVLAREHCPVLVDNDVNIMALGEQHAGVGRAVDDFLFVKIGTGIGCGIVVDGEIYRGADGLRRRHRPHPGRGRRPGLRLRQHRLPGGVLRRRGAGPRGDGGGPRRARRRLLADRLDEHGALDAPRTSRTARPRATPSPSSWSATAGAGSGIVLAGLVASSTRRWSSSAAGSAGLGHALLAEIRSVVYRRSLPLATGNLPIVLSELGPRGRRRRRRPHDSAQRIPHSVRLMTEPTQ